jgi:hypothetical protein
MNLENITLSHCLHLIAKFNDETGLARAVICVLQL